MSVFDDFISLQILDNGITYPDQSWPEYCDAYVPLVRPVKFLVDGPYHGRGATGRTDLLLVRMVTRIDPQGLGLTAASMADAADDISG